MSSGNLAILNVGSGDTKLSFDKSNPAECIRAARIVKDMLKRGYALLIEVGKDADGRAKYQRVLSFDENVCEYIIADLDPTAVEAQGEENVGATPGYDVVGPNFIGKPVKPGKKDRVKRVAADSATGVAVAPTAGG